MGNRRITLTKYSFSYPANEPSGHTSADDLVHTSTSSPETAPSTISPAPGTVSPALQNISLAIEPGEFLLICGPTGSGKTTLLRTFCPAIAPTGTVRGEIILPDPDEVTVAFVSQDPESQIVYDTVVGEIAFGLENLALPTSRMRRRIAEVVAFFGINGWLNEKTDQLSGGQKQILNLASALAMQPDVLVLDEPTAQLDPIAAKEFLAMLVRVNEELGVTVVMSEHRLEDTLLLADRVAFMRRGSIEFIAPPREFVRKVYRCAPTFAPALPASTRFAHEEGEREKYPLSVKEGRIWLEEHPDATELPLLRQARGDQRKSSTLRPPVLTAKDVWFRYRKDADFVLQRTSVAIEEGRVHAFVGQNGSGKTTLLHVLCGALKPNRGKVVKAKGKTVGLLSQDPKSVLVGDSVLEELAEWQDLYGYDREDIARILARFDLENVKHRHPYDLSGGQMQKLALAKVLLLSPDILLLDEPTKGVDAAGKAEIAQILEELAGTTTVVIVTHDIEFAAIVADQVSLLFDGGVACTDPADEFFSSNMFYTTEVDRMVQGYKRSGGDRV